MNKCSPVEMRKNLEIVNAFAKAGIDFVPVPVGFSLTKIALQAMSSNQLKKMEDELNEPN